MDLFFSIFLKMFFIMTPFFVLSVFLTVTNDASIEEKKALALKVTISIIVVSLIVVFFGKNIFDLFGITLDAFRIGAGSLLFLSAIDLVKGNKEGTKAKVENISELAVVPLAIPIVIGPGTIGILLVMGAGFEDTSSMFVGSMALVCAICLIGWLYLKLLV